MKIFFKNIESIEDLKKQYRKLCQINHPDNGGDVVIMAQINDEYAQLFNIFKDIHNKKAEEDVTGKTRPISECPEEFINIISALVSIKDLVVELCGSWIWISGATKDNKEILKSLGCKWANKKKMWYWRNEKDAVHGKKPRSMQYIREKYGTEVYSTSEILLA